MDRHDREKEMAAALLSVFYAAVIQPPHLYRGFAELVTSCDDLHANIPDVVDVLALFIARAVVDEILPPAFLTREITVSPENSKGVDAINRAKKIYLSAPLNADIVLKKWGGSERTTVEDMKNRIGELLSEYLVNGDVSEACRRVKKLKVPFFHHEIVTRALILAMEKDAEGLILELLKCSSEEGLISSSQISKGFNRIIEMLSDLCLDILNARAMLSGLISEGAAEGWLCRSSLLPLPPSPKQHPDDERKIRVFKTKVADLIQEYFLTGDILEVVTSVEMENLSHSPSSALSAIFVKKLISMAMDRKKREKEMASLLLTALPFSPEEILDGFALLLADADDASLDVPTIADDLAMFLARAVVDEVLPPQYLEELTGQKILKMAKSLLSARLAGERILRCWGGGGSSRTGWEIDDVKEKITRLLKEYVAGGDVNEACRCIKELAMPFFHHEVVKKALVALMETKNGRRLWDLLEHCFAVGLITTDQMEKGFKRVADCIDDLALDLPDAREQFSLYLETARSGGWLDSSFN